MNLTREKKEFFNQLKEDFIKQYRSVFPLFESNPIHLYLVKSIMHHYSTKHSEAQIIMSLNNLYYKQIKRRFVQPSKYLKKVIAKSRGLSVT